MTDNEIIKALECCCNRAKIACQECPYNVSYTECMGLTMKQDALALINRQKSELDDLKRDDLPRCKDALRRANEIGMRLDKENQELKAEIERLVKGFEEVKKSIEEAKVLIVKDIAKAKAEAIKEFADKLQEYLADHNAVSASYLSEFVKKLAKELTEGDSNAEITE